MTDVLELDPRLDTVPEVIGTRRPTPAMPAARLRRSAAAIGWAAFGAAAFVGVWQFAAARSPDLPSPLAVARALEHLLRNPFYDHGPNDKGIGRQLAVSLMRVGEGFGLAVAVGVPVGLLVGSSRRAWQAVNPLVQLLRPVSPLAWFPVWLAITKDAPQAAVVVIFLTALWPVVVNAAAGAADVPVEQRNVARVFKFGRLAYVRHVLVPNALPSTITGLRLSMGTAWMVIVAVEMLSGSTGIGFFVWDSYNAGHLASVGAAIVLIGVVGLLLDHVFVRLSRRFVLEVQS